MKQLRTIFSEFLADCRGTAVIETAITLPVLLFVALGFMDLTVGFAEQTKMQQHAQTGADLIIANILDLPSDSDIQAEIASATGLQTSEIAIKRITECDGVPSQVLLSVCPGMAAVHSEYIELTVSKTFEPVLGDIGVTDALGTRQLEGSVIVRLPAS